jgi:hypothetical protein
MHIFLLQPGKYKSPHSIKEDTEFSAAAMGKDRILCSSKEDEEFSAADRKRHNSLQQSGATEHRIFNCRQEEAEFSAVARGKP